MLFTHSKNDTNKYSFRQSLKIVMLHMDNFDTVPIIYLN